LEFANSGIWGAATMFFATVGVSPCLHGTDVKTLEKVKGFLPTMLDTSWNPSWMVLWLLGMSNKGASKRRPFRPNLVKK
jgi:hypothetical protein